MNAIATFQHTQRGEGNSIERHKEVQSRKRSEEAFAHPPLVVCSLFGSLYFPIMHYLPQNSGFFTQAPHKFPTKHLPKYSAPSRKHCSSSGRQRAQTTPRAVLCKSDLRFLLGSWHNNVWAASFQSLHFPQSLALSD